MRTRCAARSLPSARGGTRRSTICMCVCRPRTAASADATPSPTRCSLRRARCRSICSSRSRSTASRRATRAQLPSRRQRVLRLAARPQKIGEHKSVTVYYHGKPRVALRPPWDGGFIWTNDSLGEPLDRDRQRGTRRQRLVAEQGHAGRRARQPARRDHRSRPDDGCLERPAAQHDAQRRRHDDVRVVRHLADQQLRRRGQRRQLRALRDELRRRRGHADAGLLAARLSPRHGEGAVRAGEVRCSTCFEHWFGPYPWYADGYKLIEAPHLGMEHQSGVAYGNKFKNGYIGRDLSHTGLGTEVGLHHRARERARVVGQQHHDEGHRRHVGARELRELRRVALRGVPGREGGGRALRDRRAREHQERRADHRRVRRERRGLGRHVLQGRQHAAHDAADHRQRREVALDAARAEQDVLSPDGHRRADRGLHQHSSRASI